MKNFLTKTCTIFYSKRLFTLIQNYQLHNSLSVQKLFSVETTVRDHP